SAASPTAPPDVGILVALNRRILTETFRSREGDAPADARLSPSWHSFADLERASQVCHTRRFDTLTSASAPRVSHDDAKRRAVDRCDGTRDLRCHSMAYAFSPWHYSHDPTNAAVLRP